MRKEIQNLNINPEGAGQKRPVIESTRGGQALQQLLQELENINSKIQAQGGQTKMKRGIQAQGKPAETWTSRLQAHSMVTAGTGTGGTETAGSDKGTRTADTATDPAQEGQASQQLQEAREELIEIHRIIQAQEGVTQWQALKLTVNDKEKQVMTMELKVQEVFGLIQALQNPVQELESKEQVEARALVRKLAPTQELAQELALLLIQRLKELIPAVMHEPTPQERAWAEIKARAEAELPSFLIPAVIYARTNTARAGMGRDKGTEKQVRDQEQKRKKKQNKRNSA